MYENLSSHYNFASLVRFEQDGAGSLGEEGDTRSEWRKAYDEAEAKADKKLKAKIAEMKKKHPVVTKSTTVRSTLKFSGTFVSHVSAALEEKEDSLES